MSDGAGGLPDFAFVAFVLFAAIVGAIAAILRGAPLERLEHDRQQLVLGLVIGLAAAVAVFVPGVDLIPDGLEEPLAVAGLSAIAVMALLHGLRRRSARGTAPTRASSAK